MTALCPTPLPLTLNLSTPPSNPPIVHPSQIQSERPDFIYNCPSPSPMVSDFKTMIDLFSCLSHPTLSPVLVQFKIYLYLSLFSDLKLIIFYTGDVNSCRDDDKNCWNLSDRKMTESLSLLSFY